MRFGLPPGLPLEKADNTSGPNEDDDQPDIKTTYAHFGLAFYRAAVLEHELVNILAMTRLVSARREAERLLSDPWDDTFKSTMGKLVKQLEPQLQADPDLVADLTKALKLRNHLAHAFWRERAEDFCSDEGRATMIDFLVEARNLFQDVDERLTMTFGAGSMREAGVTAEVVEMWYRDQLQKVERGELRIPLEELDSARRLLLRKVEVR
ncbi:hypothetical protein ONO23_06069 [Micromonospora noduli]|nr:hypothetical protein ONO23_06069 [Micromonospora noduli]RAO58135.1 hypothetical protein ONO86_00274 [Micromonospora noduli]